MKNQQQRRTVSKGPAKTPLILLPAAFAFIIVRAIATFWFTLALTVLNVPVAAASRVTGRSQEEIRSLEWVPIVGRRFRKQEGELSYSERLRAATSSALKLGSSSFEAQRKELTAANQRIARLEKALAQAERNEAGLAANLAIREIQHEIQPDLRDEYDVEQKLLQLLKQRVQDTKLADEYKAAADAQSAYYNETIENLRRDLMEELSIIESQQQDKVTLDKQIQVARSVIEKLKVELAAEEKKRDEDLHNQKLKYKEQQDRVTAEFKTATDFCRDLRRKLDAETKHKDELLSKNQTLASEIEQFKKRVEEQSERLHQLDVQLKEESHQLALTQQERQRDVESNKSTVSHLTQELKVINDRIIIVQNKGAEEKAKTLENAQKEKEKTIQKYEEQIKSLRTQAEADRKKASEQHQTQVELIEKLKIKDTDDVSAERHKAAAEIKRLKIDHEHEIQRLEAAVKKSVEELEASSAILTLLKAEYEQEKIKTQELQDLVSKAEEDMKLARSDRAKLVARVEQFSKELELERNSISTKLEIEKSKLKEKYETEQKSVVTVHKEQTAQLARELAEQKRVTAESEKRLEELKNDLVSRIALLEKERSESSRRMKEAEGLAKLKENTLKETLKLQEASSQRAARLATMLSEEQRKTSALQLRLEEEIKTTQATHKERLDYVRKLESQVHIAKGLIDTLKPQYEGERAKNQGLLAEWRGEKEKMDTQVESLQRTLEAEREAAQRDKNKVNKLQTELRQLDNRNEALNRDVQVAAEGKEVGLTKEIHQTNIRVVETN